ncbi:uncharacterized protein BDW43DRAFT_311997 [Aspergillus alliaceus]|uniref:uncharacterized protein n=1 Tax=Petromyces alliaceus TaxID=209559 RepID=UPI0012A50AD0|nr:uncharacterized protein BDW43DRAFT_311997 [Aspergillus alliaceus]KAB8232612.1 hypothetical protein BDW43DRAFT_311997 [Aspergillus alliaceus]
MDNVRRFLVARIGFKLKIAVENFCVKLHIDTSSRLEIVAGSVSGSTDCRRCPAALPAWFDVRVDDEFPVLVGTAKDVSRRRCRNGRGEGNTWEEENNKSGEKSNRPVVVLLWERYREWYDVEATRSNSKSSLGQFIRFVRRIPPYIWVINQTDEEITVVVKKYAPTRRVVGTQVNVSLIGGGISLDFESSKIEGTEKKLALKRGTRTNLWLFSLSGQEQMALASSVSLKALIETRSFRMVESGWVLGCTFVVVQTWFRVIDGRRTCCKR